MISWNDPETYVDAVDIEKRGRGAVELLKDLIVKRETEYEKLSSMFLKSLKRPIQLLPRQQQAIDLANQAKALGITETIYISEQLDINRHSAYKLLRRAEDRLLIITYQSNTKMETYEHEQAIYSDARLRVSQHDIDRVVRGRTITCLTQPQNIDSCNGRASAYYGICRPCYETFTNTRYYPDGIPEWVQKMVNMNRKEQRDLARDYIQDIRLNPMDIHDVA